MTIRITGILTVIITVTLNNITGTTIKAGEGAGDGQRLVCRLFFG